MNPMLFRYGSIHICGKIVPYSLDEVKKALSCGTEKYVDSTGALTWVRPPVPKLYRNCGDSELVHSSAYRDTSESVIGAIYKII